MSTTLKFLKSKFRVLTKTGDEWFQSKAGSRFRLCLFGGTVAFYPIGIIFLNGPLLNLTFFWRHSVDYELPDHLKTTIDEQYKRWLQHENRVVKDAVNTFSIQKSTESLDTLSSGSMGVRFGTQIALPFYARFTSEEEARTYCKKNLEPFNYSGRYPLCIIWESTAGKELISTLVLSENARRFLVARDLFSNDGYNAFINKPITWATWTTFASIFAYWFHNRFTKRTILSFGIIYTAFVIITVLGCYQWHYLYRHINNCHGDDMAAKFSIQHSEGGKEYYLKMLKRNRVLRSLLEEKGDSLISPVGDERKSITPYLIRFELLKDIGIEDDEIKSVMQGDVF